MKTLPAESRHKRTMRKVSKPQMEKRRRDRINQSLEKLRLLMVDNTDDENMKNPKVGKAEILESVVQFLKTERRAQPTEQSATRPGEDSYRAGMKSCMLRVRQFIAAKEIMEARVGVGVGVGVDAGQASSSRPETRAQPSPPVPVHKALLPAPVGGCAAPSPPSLLEQNRMGHPYLSQVNGHLYDPHRMFPPTSAAPTPPSDPWRPWPQ